MKSQKHHQHRLKALGRTLLLMVALFTAVGSTRAEDEHTVIVACDWDYAPYEFINSEGKADGFNVEVLHHILKNLGIPHEFVMKARKQSLIAFMDHQADLIVDFRNRFMGEPYRRTRSNFGYYSIAVAHHKEQLGYYKVADLVKHGTIIANGTNDSITRKTLDFLPPETDLQFRSAREALAGITNGNYKYFLWGEDLLQWKIKEYNLDGIEITKLDVPLTEIHIVGYDKELIDQIDSQYARMQQSGEIDRIHNRWFGKQDGLKEASSKSILVILAILLIAIFVASIFFVMRSRVRRAVTKNEDMEAMMRQALKMGKLTVLVNNVRQNQIVSLQGNQLKDGEATLQDIYEGIHPDDRYRLDDLRKSLLNGDTRPKPYQLRWNMGTKEAPKYILVGGFSFPEYDEHGQLKYFITTCRDITEEEEKERKEREMAQRYRKMFDSTLVAMSFYDNNGMLVDLNDKMLELAGITPENEHFFLETPMQEFDLIKDEVKNDNRETFHACQRMYYPERNVDKYIEFRVRPAFDDDGNLLYNIITARDITQERDMYLELKQQNKAIQVATEDNNRYEEEMRTLMENCKMYIWSMDLETGIISFSQTLGTVLFKRTIEDHILGMFESEREAAWKTMENIGKIKDSFSTLHHFLYTPINEKPSWYATSGMPIRDHQGKTISLFGIVRDVTELMEAQERLKEETARAENSGILKATFLANMTHEIRTPLNAIVGFSDLLHMVDSTDERREFIRIIRNNCDMLMRLINDIFEASTLDVKPLEIKLAEVDFAQDFALTCQSLSQRVQNPNVKFIVENPYESFVTVLDKGRIQQVITNFVTNAVKYTQEGHIRVGYTYTDGGLRIYCEDTGAGIPKEKQKSVFDRFVKLNDYVQGTGLGLNICKAIAERSNGRIGVDSEGEGHGSTFWIWVPCHVISQKEQENGGGNFFPSYKLK